MKQICGEKERRFSVNICTQPIHVQDSNHVNNFNETLYNVNSLDDTLYTANSLNETLLNESKLQNNSHIEHTVQNKTWKSDTSNKPNVIKKNRLICLPVYMNARSIMNKMAALEASILEYDPDVIGITESWTTENHLQSELQLEGYTGYRKYRMMCEWSKGGGVLIYMKKKNLHREKNHIIVNNS